MTNIPTELLRALIAVVDQGSFTKAAAALGLTQPAVSAQIKRLQFLLGCELFDRSTHGIKLTPQGERVVSYARRLLSINDQIIDIGSEGPRPELVIRLGTPGDFVASALPRILARFRERWPDVRFTLRTGIFDALVRDLHSGELDIVVGLSKDPPHDARHSWEVELAWVRSPTSPYDAGRPVPLVSFGEGCIYQQVAMDALARAKFDWEEVFTGPTVSSLVGAINSGLGIMPMIRRRAEDLGMFIWDNSPLPKLNPVYSGIYVREGGVSVVYEQLADDIYAEFKAENAGPLTAAPALRKARTPVG